ncbi:MAG: protein CapI [Nanoarchaeota archaeon]|nr:protein CapI [Nanoarchaeota archaeon]HCX24180.1 protein CapI [Cytophagales bacterium]|tara:strand:- start:128 stop:1081 length:954 start_codon:yes stop_codon:yes gene_type:complete
MKVLVTGGAGFIGSHVCKLLLERGDDVICVDNFSDYYSPQLKEDRVKQFEKYPTFKLYKVDMTNFEALKLIFEQHQIDAVCHLAAQAGVLPSITNPFIYQKTNIVGTLNIFECSKLHKVPHVVSASSSSVYGKNTDFPSSEHHKVDQPISLYAATKKSGEMIAHYYSHLFNIKTTVLRFFNVYGPWGRPDMMAWKFTNNIIKREPIEVYNYGDTWKDYTYVEDIANGVVKAIDHHFDFEIINLGNKTPEHLKRCIQIIEQTVSQKAVINFHPLQPGDVVKSCADVSKAKQLLDWEPTTKIDVGLPNFINWFREYNNV